MADDPTNRKRLLTQDYADDRKLADRQAIYRFQTRPADLHGAAIDLAAGAGAWDDPDLVVDAGCGNAIYLERIRERAPQAAVVGVDLSTGMLQAATHPSGRLAGDLAHLPLRAGAAGIALAFHMLYHLPDPPAGVAELRRVVRPGGVTVATSNGPDHQQELDAVVAAALERPGWRPARVAVDLDRTQRLLAALFPRVARVDLRGELVVPDPAPVVAYALSMRGLADIGDTAAVEERIDSLVGERIHREGAFRITTHTGALAAW